MKCAKVPSTRVIKTIYQHILTRCELKMEPANTSKQKKKICLEGRVYSTANKQTVLINDKF